MKPAFSSGPVWALDARPQQLLWLEQDCRPRCAGERCGGAPPPYPLRVVANGSWEDYGIREDHTLAVWGDWGEVPLPALPAGEYLTLSVSLDFGCAIATDLHIECWAIRTPAPTPPAGRFTELSVARGFACAVREDDGIVCWTDREAYAPVVDVPSEVRPG